MTRHQATAMRQQKAEAPATESVMLKCPVLRGVATFAATARRAPINTLAAPSRHGRRGPQRGLGKTFGVVSSPGAGKDAPSSVFESRPHGTPA